jgi:SAM-dependent methyltransferase
MTSGWLAFWDKPNSIYVNERHRDVHYRLLAEQIAKSVPSPSARVLDYGSGEALHADRIAAVAGEVLLCDAGPSVRANVAARFAGNPKIRVLAPDDVARLQEQSLDLIVFHSVAQYLEPQQTYALFALFRRLLKPDGILIVGDVIPHKVAIFDDVGGLLRLAAQNGFFGAALVGLLRTALSEYSRLRLQIGITTYSAGDVIARLDAAGFSSRRTGTIVGYNHSRMTFIARPRQAAAAMP